MAGFGYKSVAVTGCQGLVEAYTLKRKVLHTVTVSL